MAKKCECCGRYRESSSEHFICNVCEKFCKNKKTCCSHPTVLDDVLGIHKVCIYYNEDDVGEEPIEDRSFIYKCYDCYNFSCPCYSCCEHFISMGFENMDDIDDKYYGSMSFDEFMKIEKTKYKLINNVIFCKTYGEYVNNDYISIHMH